MVAVQERSFFNLVKETGGGSDMALENIVSRAIAELSSSPGIIQRPDGYYHVDLAAQTGRDYAAMAADMFVVAASLAMKHALEQDTQGRGITAGSVRWIAITADQLAADLVDGQPVVQGIPYTTDLMLYSPLSPRERTEFWGERPERDYFKIGLYKACRHDISKLDQYLAGGGFWDMTYLNKLLKQHRMWARMHELKLPVGRPSLTEEQYQKIQGILTAGNQAKT